MTWNDFYQRRDVITAVLEKARGDPEGTLPFAEVSDAEHVFGSEENLLLALHYKWTQILTGHLRGALGEPEDTDTDRGDSVDAVTKAWHAAVAAHPTLHGVVDAGIERHPGTLRHVHEAEMRMLALTAGLADPAEPAEEVTKVGSAFLALLRDNPAPARRRGPVGNLLRILAPTG